MRRIYVRASVFGAVAVRWDLMRTTLGDAGEASVAVAPGVEVLIADRSALHASATARVVEGIGHRVVSVVTQLPDLEREVHATWPDVIVVGLGSTASEWYGALRMLRELAPTTPVIACGGRDRTLAMDAISSGVSEYFIGQLDPERLAHALERARHGRIHLRLAREIAVAGSVPDSEDTRPFTGWTRDIGAAGVSFWCPRSVVAGQVVQLTLVLPGTAPVSGRAKVLSTIEDRHHRVRGSLVRAAWAHLDQPEDLHEFMARELDGGSSGPTSGPGQPGTGPTPATDPSRRVLGDSDGTPAAVEAARAAVPTAASIVDAIARRERMRAALRAISTPCRDAGRAFDPVDAPLGAAVDGAGPDGGSDVEASDPLADVVDLRHLDVVLDAAAATDAASALVLVVDVAHSGHDRWAGDEQLLVPVARHLTRVLDGRGTLARLSGLTFAVVDLVGEDTDPRTEAEVLGRRLIRSFAVPFCVPHGVEYLSVRIGAATAATAETSRALVVEAMSAMVRASYAGGDGVQLVHATEALAGDRAARAAAAAALTAAVTAGDLALLVEAGHPLASDRASTGRAVACWHRDAEGMLGPDEYGDLADECGLTLPIWAMTLRAVCGRLWRSRAEDGAAKAITVHLPTCVAETPECVAEVRAALAEWPVDGARLVVELVDAAAVAESAAAVRTVEVLHGFGLTISARGFGGRRAPTAAIRSLPISEVTLDPTLTRDVATDGRALEVLTGVVELAQAMGLTTVAVDVETADAAALLRDAGIDFGFGPHWSTTDLGEPGAST